MSTAEIIRQIEQLPPEGQREVIQFAYRLDADHTLSGKQLGELARRMVEATDEAEALRWRDTILRGFYGRAVDA